MNDSSDSGPPFNKTMHCEADEKLVNHTQTLILCNRTETMYNAVLIITGQS